MSTREHPRPAPARVLVTGGAGYVGSASLRALIRAGIDGWAVDDLSTGNAGAVPPDRLIVQDIRDTARLAALLSDLEVDAVLHAAALTSVPGSFAAPAAYWSANLDGTRSVLDAMLRAGVPRLVLCSTAAVYRPGAARPLREDDPLAPTSPYGASKLAAEDLARDYCERYGLTCLVLRYFNAAGADADGCHGEARAGDTHVIPALLEVALGRRSVFEVCGTAFATRDGSCIRDYVSVADLAAAHRRALAAALAEPFTVCNLGSGRGASVRELLAAARRVTGCAIPDRAAPPRPGDAAVLVADSTRARALLGWAPVQSDLDSVLATAWAWHRRHPDGYGPTPGA